MSALFHYAFHVTSLDETRLFYTQVLGCIEGRSTETWVDFDLRMIMLATRLCLPH